MKLALSQQSHAFRNAILGAYPDDDDFDNPAAQVTGI